MTKNIFIIPLLVSLLFSPSWSESIEDLVKRNGLYYKKFTDTPFTGEISGIENGKFKKGKREGKWIYYHENGQLWIKRNYRKGMEEGPWEEYYKNGQLEYKGNYKDGKRDGLYEEYYTVGKLKSKGIYKDGKKNGLFESYYVNGVVEKKEIYKNGVKQE